jgi:hypothetical protein
VNEVNKENEFKTGAQIKMLMILYLKGRCQGDDLKEILRRSIQYFKNKSKVSVSLYKLTVNKEKFDSAVDIYKEAVQSLHYCSILTEENDRELQ